MPYLFARARAAETILRGTMRTPSIVQNSSAMTANVQQSTVSGGTPTRMQQLLQRKTDLDKMLNEKILLLQQLCRQVKKNRELNGSPVHFKCIFCVFLIITATITQESQVGSYLDDKTLRRKKYANTIMDQQPSSHHHHHHHHHYQMDDADAKRTHEYPAKSKVSGKRGFFLFKYTQLNNSLEILAASLICSCVEFDGSGILCSPLRPPPINRVFLF